MSLLCPQAFSFLSLSDFKVECTFLYPELCWPWGKSRYSVRVIECYNPVSIEIFTKWNVWTYLMKCLKNYFLNLHLKMYCKSIFLTLTIKLLPHLFNLLVYAFWKLSNFLSIICLFFALSLDFFCSLFRSVWSFYFMRLLTPFNMD
jgi:hypothetical protein